MTLHCAAVRVVFAVAVVLDLAPGRLVDAQTPPAARPRCDAAEHRQFDFWIGRWQVSAPDGRVLGHNTIARTLDGCVIHERWDGGGMQGESFNIWDRTSGRWHQTWVSSTGQLLLLNGTFENGVMQMTGDSGPPERRVTNRLIWTPSADGTLTQRWEISSDGGTTWQVVFSGNYRPIGSERKETPPR